MIRARASGEISTHVSAPVDRDPVGPEELPLARPFGADRPHKTAGGVEHLHPVVAAIGHVDEARGGLPGASDAIWSLLNLELWYRTYIDGEGVQTLPAVVPARAGTGATMLQATA